MNIKNTIFCVILILIISTIISCTEFVDINVKQGSTSIPSGTGEYNFGLINSGSSSEAIIFTIYNNGNIDLNLTGNPIINISGTDVSMFSVIQPTTSIIERGKNTNFTITFSPTSTGIKTATVSIENDDPDENPYTFNIKGYAPTTEDIEGLIELSARMSGFFDSQYQHDTTSWAWDVNLAMKRIWTTATNNYWLYVEQAIEYHPGDGYTPGVQPPYRQRIYKLELVGENEFASSVYEFNNPTEKANATNIWDENSPSYDPTPLDHLTESDFTRKDGCTVYLSKDTNGNFVGGTIGKNCETTYPGATYTTSEVTIFSTGMRSWDRMFNDSDVQVGGAPQPYNFNKHKNFDTELGNFYSEINLKRGSNDIPSGTGSYDFGNETSGSSTSPTSFTIESLGDLSLHLTGTPIVNIFGSDASMFSIVQPAKTLIVSGQTVSFTIIFSPTIAGLKTATISIANDDVDENPYTFNITGTAE